MNPCDALTKDYSMYYDSCWMKHDKWGVGKVRVVGGELYFYQGTSVSDEAKKVTAKSLTCWWPRPGAHNVKTGAVYIARRSMRNMRKSAIGGDHYFVKWGSPYGVKIMSALRDGPNLVPLHKAVEMVQSGKQTSVAVSRDVILTEHDDPNTCSVIFRGLESGTYSHGCYTPGFSESPLTGRILRQLEARQ